MNLLSMYSTGPIINLHGTVHQDYLEKILGNFTSRMYVEVIKSFLLMNY